MNISYFFKINILIFILTLSNNFLLLSLDKQPVLVDGILDIKDFNLEKGSIDLKGYWEFYWEKEYNFTDIENLNKNDKTFIYAPSLWNNLNYKSVKLPNNGYATYHLRIINSMPDYTYSLKIPVLLSSYKVWINGVLYNEVGKFGTSYEKQIPNFKTVFIFFQSKEKYIDIILHISNFKHHNSGLSEDIKFGAANTIFFKEQIRLIYNLFLLGVLLIIFVYHIGLFIFMKKDFSALYFAFFCFIILIRIIFIEDRLHNIIFPFLPWAISLRIEYLTLVVPGSIFYMFLRSLFPDYYYKKIQNIFIILTIVLSLSVIILSPEIFSGFLLFYDIFVLIIGFYMIFFLIIAVINKIEYAKFVLTGTFILLLATINDILVVHNILKGIQLFSLGLFIFIVLQALILAQRFSKAFTEKEKAQLEAIKNHEIALLNKQEAIENLNQVDRIKDEFLANTSHELKTPLNSVIGFSDILIENSDNNLSDDSLKILQIISSSAKRLSALINNILEFTNMKNNDLRIYKENIDLKKIANYVINICKPLVDSKKLELINKIPDNLPLVYADENRLEQILSNLIDNAIKFTETGKIEISAELTEDMLIVSIEDTGIGIQKNKFEEIFIAFHQIDMTTTRKYGGSGIGLALTKILVELHGGTIWLESEPRNGSKFIFTIPLSLKK